MFKPFRCFLKWGYPQIIHFSLGFSNVKPCFLGYPHCRKPPSRFVLSIVVAKAPLILRCGSCLMIGHPDALDDDKHAIPTTIHWFTFFSRMFLFAGRGDIQPRIFVYFLSNWSMIWHTNAHIHIYIHTYLYIIYNYIYRERGRGLISNYTHTHTRTYKRNTHTHLQ